MSMRLRPVHWVSVAAVLMIAVGTAAFTIIEVMQPAGVVVPPPFAAAPLPEDLAHVLVERHEACLRSNAHQRTVAAGAVDRDLVRQDLEDKLHQAVHSLNPKDTNWTLVGAAPCEMNGRPIAHLEYARGSSRISVISMPVSACSAGNGETVTYDGTFEGHPIAALRDRTGVFAIVGSGGNISLDELMYLREYMLHGDRGMCSTPYDYSTPASHPSY